MALDFSRVPRQLDSKTCIRREHPDCEYHFTALQRYFYLRKKIAEAWDELELAVAKRRLATLNSKAGQCEKHWQSDCYLCCKTAQLDKEISKWRKEIRNKWFALTELLIEQGVIKRLEPLPKVQSTVDDAWKAPISRLFDQNEMRPIADTLSRSRVGFADSRDNIRLLRAVARGMSD